MVCEKNMSYLAVSKRYNTYKAFLLRYLYKNAVISKEEGSAIVGWNPA
jgi:hypothetical protein